MELVVAMLDYSLLVASVVGVVVQAFEAFDSFVWAFEEVAVASVVVQGLVLNEEAFAVDLELVDDEKLVLSFVEEFQVDVGSVVVIVVAFDSVEPFVVGFAFAEEEQVVVVEDALVVLPAFVTFVVGKLVL